MIQPSHQLRIARSSCSERALPRRMYSAIMIAPPGASPYSRTLSKRPRREVRDTYIRNYTRAFEALTGRPVHTSIFEAGRALARERAFFYAFETRLTREKRTHER